MTPYKKMAHQLYERASAQGGYFTTKQAQEAGYAASTHSYNVKAGNWFREHRGIYRLAAYPNSERPDLILWSLWSCNRKGKPQGVYSHQTALSIHDLSDLMPAKLHMTVPLGFRRNSSPAKDIVLHKGSLHKSDVEDRHGFRVTRPLKTIVDLLTEGNVSSDHMQQAIRQGIERGLFTRSEVEHSTRIPPELKKRIAKLSKGA